MMELVDPKSYLPRYVQLANILRQRIVRGEWAALQPIPSERQLEQIYSVSRTTIRQAIDLMVRQGFSTASTARAPSSPRKNCRKGSGS